MINKKGDIYFGLMTAIMLFICGVAFLNLVKDNVGTARTDIGCSTPASISAGTKLLCLVADSSVIYLFILIISLAGGFITDKLTIGR